MYFSCTVDNLEAPEGDCSDSVDLQSFWHRVEQCQVARGLLRGIAIMTVYNI